jgi:putative transposase
MPRGDGIYPDVGRQTPAGGAHIFLGRENIFFVTVSAKDRTPWMANASVQTSLVKIWGEESSAWLVGFYLIMPDHIHFFCRPRDLHFGIDQWIAYWKRQFSRQHVAEFGEWQRRAFHHRMRNRIEYDEKFAYVRENPVRKQLAKSMDEWPYQGFVHDVRYTTG